MNFSAPRPDGVSHTPVSFLFDYLPSSVLVGFLFLSVWSALTAERLRRGDVSAKTDTILFFFVAILRSRDGVFGLLSPLWKFIFVRVFQFVLLSSVPVLIYLFTSPKPERAPESRKFLQPLVFPSRTTHARQFPKRHSFGYSYLFVGVPVCSREGKWPLLTRNDATYHRSRGWFSVNAEDYLARNDKMSLVSKLRDYLQSEGVGDSEWSDAYLITAPRFLGYSFNPVSFWYVYTATRELTFVILEVNNTFDERRMYLLRRGERDESAAAFTGSWPKDFHVSPFNSVKGSYSLVTADPFDPRHPHPRLSVAITLRSSHSHAKLVARAFSTSPPVCPASLSPLARARLVFSWSLSGFLTHPRILREASRLFFRRGLHVWFRPEVAPTSIGRHSTPTERLIAACLRTWLAFTVPQILCPVSLMLHDAELSPSINFFSPRSATCPARSLRLTVLTPAFYSRLAHYPSITLAFQQELGSSSSSAGSSRARTLLADGDLSVLDDLAASLAAPSARRVPESRSPLAALRWSLLRHLRHPAPPLAYPAILQPPGAPAASVSSAQTPKSEPEPEQEPEPFGEAAYSELDVFVSRHGGEGEAPPAWAYRRAVTGLFIAGQAAWGFEGLVWAVDVLLVRAALCWVGWGCVVGAFSAGAEEKVAVREVVRDAVGAAGVHLWAWVVKGL